MKKFISFVLILSLLSIMIFSNTSTSEAATAPTSASYAYYVTYDWNTIQGSTGHTKAYNLGKSVPVGSGTVYLFLDFGRQVITTTSSGLQYGVLLTNGDGSYKDNAWVKSVVEQYRAGYDARSNPVSATIVVGTNNNEWDWPKGSQNWTLAGTSWAGLVKLISSGIFTNKRWK